jgi:hypothetical protein
MARIFGIFKVQTKITAPVKVILMANTIVLSNPSNLQHVFDLKGSTINREVLG